MERNDGLLKYLPYCLTVFVLVIVIYIRIRLLSIPLERDEGEFAYIGQLLLKGVSPFSNAYTLKLPGVSIMYALFMFLFGQSIIGIHLGLLIVNSACIFFVYLLAKRLFDQNAALFSCTSYAILSLSSSVVGVFAHATHFVTLFVLAGFLLLLRSIDKKQIKLMVISGFCFGIAFTMKQHALPLLLFAVIYLLWSVWKNNCFDKSDYIVWSILFLFGILIPYVLIIIWVVETGCFEKFWFWTVQYAHEYVSIQTLESGWNNFKSSFRFIAKSQLPLWYLSGLGFILLFTKINCCKDRLFVLGFLIFSFFAICPGLIFREHYFVLVLPAASIMIGSGIVSSFHIIKSLRFTLLIQTLILVAAIIYGLYNEKDRLFVLSPLETSRVLYGANPFPESIRIANYIKNNSTPNDKIAIIGSEPEILFYSDRLSATGHIYMYGLMENQPYAERMQMEMINEIEAACPKYIIYVNVEFSWLEQEFSDKTIFHWKDQYIELLYDKVGVIDIGYTTRYMWNDAAIGYKPMSRYFLSVFKRKIK